MLKYSVKFSIKNNETDEPTPLRLRVSFNSLRIELYPRIMIKPSQFDNTKQVIKGDIIAKKKMSKVVSHIDSVFEKYDYEKNRYPTSKELKAEFKALFSDSDITNKDLVLDIFDLFIENASILKQWADGTRKSYISIKNHWSYYLPNRKINELTEKDLMGFIQYFQKAPIDHRTKKTRKPHRNTTVEKNIADFKTMLQWASDKKYYEGDLHNTFKPVFKGTSGDLKEIVYLEWDELMKLFNHDFGIDRLNNVRDVFCFCCFTGVRFSDAKKLRREDIRNDYMLVTTEKTIDPLKVDLNNYALSILNDYKDNDMPLPIISQDKTNEYIKEIAEILEFNDPVTEVFFVGEKRYKNTSLKKEVLSTHAGRRTFVVNSLKLGIPTVVIRSWTGHKDDRAMKPYIKIVDELKSKEMNKFNSDFTPRNIPRKNDT
ncbi:site-specific integrase [Riemerella columbina]|uniref:site-specific integrase n=1 Tax=Riemerella columbina TaxID=103810 RepID=UPI0003761E3E|nr:site-specific integrase [Riemerella columbina]